MHKKSEGPFRRKSIDKTRDFSIHAPWVGAAIALIAIAQLPIAIKTSLDLICITKGVNENNPTILLCKDL
ncbi:hypothetical protein [Prochlorococcus sp. MIT 1223]|uniref:hypothetical protein n=1 Tax=Prochlorococcus sp. MIT 1223 TaxID=3096217 RepID=UPI002A762B68|nr:hypothetical protein [Prochlorococcus sp. MIT 1223]